MYTIGEVAKLASVSVRTLHHYDSIGLVSPSERSASGYRLYCLNDLETLQQVLFYRECGFTLDAIKQLMFNPAVDREHALSSQRHQLANQSVRLQAMIDLIDRTLQSLRKGVAMNPEDMFSVFGDFDPSQYEDEAKQRWGDTDAYKESARRTKAYTAADWKRIQQSNEKVSLALIAAFDGGVRPESIEAMDIAESARLAIDHAFYPCSHQMHTALAEAYVSDARFRAYYDDQREGLAAWFAAAIQANGRRHRPH